MSVATTETCPLCDADLRGDPIPEKYRHHNIPGEPFFNEERETCEEQRATNAAWNAKVGDSNREPRCFCLPYGDATHFKRGHIVEIRGVYDGGLYKVCPDCGGAYHRWTDPHMMAKAQWYIDRHNTELAEESG